MAVIPNELNTHSATPANIDTACLVNSRHPKWNQIRIEDNRFIYEFDVSVPTYSSDNYATRNRSIANLCVTIQFIKLYIIIMC